MSESTNARMLELTRIIAAKTSIVCSPPAEGLNAAEALKKARLELVDATDELNNLAKDPKEALQSLAWSHTTSFTIQYITHFNIAASVPENSSISLTTLASLTKTNETTLQRILRHCMINHIFTEPNKGFIAHTTISSLLRDNSLSIAWAGLMSDDIWPITAHAVAAIEKWPDSSEPTETAVTLAHGTASLFSYLGKFPQKAARFGLTMKAFSSGPGFEPETLAAHYLWQNLPPGSTVVDIGSSDGFISVAIAQAHPSLNFVCQDLPVTIAAAAEKVPVEVRDRITFQEHDFLTPNPVVGAAVYFFRFVFHNWSDIYCIRILRALIPALKSGSRVLINDTMLPERGR